ncbi:MAG: hypothetical protein CSYNP_02099 [Syntrophus sp. SKADARSKE-3]|nr:hypothetical protein [Syntrophus sp. SKADARSKE-3]
MQIPIPENLNIEWILNRLRTSSFGVLYHFKGNRVLRRPLWLTGVPVVAEFDLRRKGKLSVRIVAKHNSSTRPGIKQTVLLAELATQARILWGLDDDASNYHAAIASDPDLATLFQRFGALHILRAPDVYECLLIAIIGQQVSVSAAQAIRRRLMEHLGTTITVAGDAGEEKYSLLPSPQQLIATSEDVLRTQGVSRQKAAYLMGIAHRAEAGELDRAVFAKIPDEEVIQRLCEIKGVGRWTAEIVMMFGLGRPDIFPAGDLGLQAALQKSLGLPARPTEKAVRKIAERWIGWRSYAALYLWTSIQARAL